MSTKVLVTRQVIDTGIKLIKAEGYEVEIWQENSKIPAEILVEKSKTCDALITMLEDDMNENILKELSHIKVISNYAVGFNNIDINKATELGIKIGNTPDVLTDATAELALSLLLSTSRRIIESYQSIKNGQWLGWEPQGFLGPQMKGKTLGVIGLGRIGGEFARMCHQGLGMNIIYTARTDKTDLEKKINARRVELEQLLKESDVISLHCNLNEATHNLINKETLLKMKPGAIFINTARGAMHNENDLLWALDQKILAGIGLDVTNPEPMDKNHELLKRSNVVVTPHIGSATYEARAKMSEICAKNIIAGLQGKSLYAPVN